MQNWRLSKAREPTALRQRDLRHGRQLGVAMENSAYPYAHVPTVHMCRDIAGAGRCGDEPFRLARSAHSYSVCRNLRSESGAL